MADNYHLKWDSHLSHLNTSVSTLYKNEKFADVLLYSSSDCSLYADNPNIGISAHKFILSSCSKYFSTIFENTQLLGSNTTVSIVLPPGLSHRSIQILVEYMYNGEATVSKDIISEVLRGGEILKIRGLCRSSPFKSQQHDMNNIKLNGSNNLSSVNFGKCKTRYSKEHQHQDIDALRASFIPKASPVIIKSPKLVPIQSDAIKITKKNHISIAVNKEIAIDPEDISLSKAHQIEPISELRCTTPQCTETIFTSSQLDKLDNRWDERQRHSNINYCMQIDDFIKTNNTKMLSNYNNMNQTNCKRSSNKCGMQRADEEYFGQSIQCPQTHKTSENFVKETESIIPHSPELKTTNNGFLLIKEEPPNENNIESCRSINDMPPEEHLTNYTLESISNANIKIETGLQTSDEKLLSTSEIEYDNICTKIKAGDNHKKAFNNSNSLDLFPQFHPLGCLEKPQQTTTDAQITKHSKTSLSNNITKKRRRTSQLENDDEHVTLYCDLCLTTFETPAEWVRHINNQHTEIELAIFNSRKTCEQKFTYTSRDIYNEVGLNHQDPQRHSQNRSNVPKHSFYNSYHKNHNDNSLISPSIEN